MSNNSITKEEFNEWKENEITKKILFELREARSLISKGLENGNTLQGGHGTIEETAKAVGILYGIDLILELRNNI